MIRDANPSDAPALASLWNPWINGTAITFNPVPKSADDIAAMIFARQAGGQAFVLAEKEGGLLGFATYGQFRGGPGYAHTMEHTVILNPGARGHGHGRALMAAVEDHARLAGHRLMIGAVSGENTEGRAFHEAVGYTLYGTLPQAGFKFGRHMDLWLLGKLL